MPKRQSSIESGYFIAFGGIAAAVLLAILTSSSAENPLQSAIEQEIGVCGNKDCTADESCTSCPDDCGPCPDLLNVNTVRDSAKRVSLLLADAQNSTLRARFSQREQEQIAALQDATQLDFWTRSHVTRMLRSLERAIAEETQMLSATVSDLLQTGTLEEQWPLLDTEKIEDAVAEENVQELLHLFPPSLQDLESLSRELQKFADALNEEAPSSPSANLFEKALAAEEREGLDPKERFRFAVSLLGQAMKDSRDPRVILPLLQEKLSHLDDERDTVGRILRRIGERVEGASLEELLLLQKEMQTLLREMDATHLDTSFASAVENMDAHAATLQANIISDTSPKTHAQALLRREGGQDIVDTLTGNDVDVQKEYLSRLFAQQREEMGEKADAFSDDLSYIESTLMAAKTSLDIRQALDEWAALLDEIQSTARAEKGPLLRFIYLLQDFFGRI